jgi:hypothetical protein
MWLAGLTSLVVSGVLASAGPASASASGSRPDAPFGGVRWTQVDAVSARDVWAAGQRFTDVTVVAHYNGKSWSKLPALPTAVLRLSPPELMGASSARNLWVADPDYSAKFAHWNGKSWKLYRMPSGVSDLSGIAVLSSDDAWACGVDEDDASMLLHWNGTSWQRVPSPSPGGFSDAIGIDMRTANSGWAVGSDGDGLMILRWNGSTWQSAPAPSPSSTAILYSVDASSAGNAWAVGITNDTARPRTLFMRWNGTTWAKAAAPSFPVGGEAYNQELGLFSIVVINARDAWAGGFYHVKTAAGAAPVILRWNGTKWSKGPRPAGVGVLELSAVSERDIWATAETDGGAGWTILRWNGSAWKKVLTS